MGGGKGRQDQPTLSQVPDSTCKVEDRIKKLQLRLFPLHFWDFCARI